MLNGTRTVKSATALKGVAAEMEGVPDKVTVVYPNGGKYIGTLNDYDGNLDGEGTLIWPSGRQYIGEWAHGKRNGNGTMFAVDGTVGQSGLWIHDAVRRCER